MARQLGEANNSTEERKRSIISKSFEVLGKSTRWTVAGLVGLTLLIRRDAWIVNFTAGAILNAFLGKTLKRIINEARPHGAKLEDPGMPSSHAMALFYMMSFLTLALSRGLPEWWPLSYLPTVATLITYVTTASAWRVTSGLHTFAQIFVGATVSSLVGIRWHHYCVQQLNSRLSTYLLERYPPNGQVPFAYVAGVMLLGALTVGSVERKIAKMVKKVIRKAEKRVE